MSTIKDIRNPWRDRYQLARFRSASFHTNLDARSSGRRGAVHEYPKRNEPYAEDMGRRARRFSITGYCIGPDYLIRKDALIKALEEDGPGALRLPLPYEGRDMEVLCLGYTVTETQERGGMCGFEMEFVEAGKPGFSTQITNTVGAIENSARSLEGVVGSLR